ncbi:reticulon-4 isoform X2 [Spea bombifrons]|uniref:reticulon-4 isoform X2 n=1 Tax=Spea bombifrons TaxID=233779 RepID=UPI00234A9EF0|nr:reticulon-4 isoform X2 [Spea bombifrons]
MEDQSPFISSSNSGLNPYGSPDDEQPELDRKRWEELDVLDLTGGAGGFPPSSQPHRVRDQEEEEDEKPSYSDSLEPSPEEEEPSSISSDQPAASVVPSAPMEEEEEDERPTVPSRGPTGSVDENLFPLTAASAPLMHSSADKVLDLPQTYSAMSAGQEELASMLLEPATSAPSLSPLSADSFKEHISSVAFHADLTPPEALQGSISDTHAVARSVGELGFHEKLVGVTETDHAEVAFQKQAKEDLIFSERGYVVEHPTSQQETASEDSSQYYAQSAKEMFSGMLKSVGPPSEAFSEIKEARDEQYADFKPFESTRSGDVGAVKFDSNVYSLNLESVKEPERKYEEDKLDLSDDITPVTPVSPIPAESPDYEMLPPLDQSPLTDLGDSPILGNKTDEKKMAEAEARVTSDPIANLATLNPFFEHVGQDYVTTGATTEVPLVQATSKPEGLTPDIVQEAYESEAHDTGVTKLGYESKIDLVQTAAKSVQESVTPTAQAPALFEGTESVSSPVLPDIVMEAPLTSASVGLESGVFQPDVSPMGSAPVSEEKIKFESEKPPSYEEAVRKTVSPEQAKAAPSVEEKRESPVEVEAPYISIACDLIKETIPTESSAPALSKAIHDDFESQFIQHFDDSSPESEPSEPSYKHWEPEAPAFVSGPSTEAVKEKDKPLQMEEFGMGFSSGKTPSPKYSPGVELAHLESSLPGSPAEDLTPKAPCGVLEEPKLPEKPIIKDIPSFEKNEDLYSALSSDQTHDKKDKPLQGPDESNDFAKAIDLTTKEDSLKPKEPVAKPLPPSKKEELSIPSTQEKKEVKDPEVAATATPAFKNSAVDLIYWRDIKKSGVVFGASLFLLLSLTVFSIVSVAAYIALALLSVSISFRIYKGVLQAIQKSDEGHPFRSYLESSVAVSEDVVQKYSNVAMNHINCTIKELRRLFLVEDLVDSLKFAVLMWVFTYIGALFNGLTLLILALISLFSVPVIYERHQTQVDHYLALVNKNVKNITDMVVAKIPGLKRKAE